MRNLLILLAMIAAMVAAGCDSQTIMVNNSKGNNDNNPIVNNDNNPIVNNDNNHAHDDHEGHGVDDDAVLIEPGFLSGSWRVARSEDDKPLVYLEFFHDTGASEATGNFMMGDVISEWLDGQTGDIEASSWQDGKLEVRWNPTTDDEEVYVITETARVSDDLFTGTFHGTRNPDTFEVTIQRRVFEDEDPTDQ